MKISFFIFILFFLSYNAQAKLPTNLKESTAALHEFLSDEEEEALLKYDEKNLILAYDMSLGNYIRNEWLYDEELPLYTYFTDMCVQTPHQMSHIVLISYHRMRKKKLVNLEDQIEEMIGEKAFKKCKGDFSTGDTP